MNDEKNYNLSNHNHNNNMAYDSKDSINDKKSSLIFSPSTIRLAQSRLTKELHDISKNPPKFCVCGPIQNNLFCWHAALLGQENTLYEGGIFFLKLKFPKDYPLCPPKVTFLTRVYHMNISESGNLFLDIFTSEHWSPAFTIPKVLLAISSLLKDINLENPVVPPIANQYITDRDKYMKLAREATKTHAI